MREKLINLSFIVASILIICHVAQLIDGGFNIETLLRIALCATYIPAGLIWREKSLPVVFPIFAYAILIFNGYNNYTSFFIIVFSIELNKKWRYQYLIFYLIDVTIALVLHHLGATHAIIHILNCVFIYACYKILFSLKPKAKLNLEPDEAQILAEWAQVKELKAVRSFSHNTVYDKLRAARLRNDCTSNDELLKKYIEEYANQYAAGSK
uniref:Uncharacterized protein n=1 Tax=Siphoviridae sp. ctzm5103 TaxID=2825750 RepID=A0A8S5TT62_9CAUD|nr:MAG TPA: hypothetical protein [Siphoviridae sp. ctzm5103]